MPAIRQPGDPVRRSFRLEFRDEDHPVVEAATRAAAELADSFADYLRHALREQVIRDGFLDAPPCPRTGGAA